MRPKPAPDYLAGYPPELVRQIEQLIERDHLGDLLLQKYPLAHGIRTDKALYDYVLEIKEAFLRNAGPLNKVAFDNKLHVIRNALGTHSRISQVQGSKLRTRREILVAGIFREMPLEFLRMIVAHELAHIRESNHDKAFYQLCRHMEPDYHQLEFDLRAYLCHLEVTGKPLWPVKPAGD